MRLPPKLLAIPCLVLSACATGERSEPQRDLLIVYADAYASAGLGWRCHSTIDLSGLATPRYERLRRNLHDRRFRVRDRLIAAYGSDRVEEIERTFEEDADRVYWTGCDLNETARTRQRYRRLLKQLELRTQPRS